MQTNSCSFLRYLPWQVTNSANGTHNAPPVFLNGVNDEIVCWVVFNRTAAHTSASFMTFMTLRLLNEVANDSLFIVGGNSRTIFKKTLLCLTAIVCV